VSAEAPSLVVEMRTVKQAARVATATGGVHLPGKPGNDGAQRLSRRVKLRSDFEAYRDAVEKVSVLFSLYEQHGEELVPVPSGWTVTGARFEVEWPDDQSLVRSHFGARRFAYNWALGHVKADMDAKASDHDYESTKWGLEALRKRWNQDKDSVAPWWAANSKEAYSSGIADLVTALSNWRQSKDGKRKGHKVGFPKFKTKRQDHARVRFSTGAMRFEADRRTIIVPVIGALRSKENTRRVQRPLAQGRARILNMTVSEQWGRLFVSVNYAVRTSSVRPVAKPGTRAGVDLGLRTLATVADTDGNITEVANPAPLRATLAQRRKAGRQMSRRIPGSKGHEQAKTKLARLDRRVVHLRREAWHQVTTWLAATYEEVVIEDLDIAAMEKSMGRRPFRRSVSDAALGTFRPLLSYKMGKAGTAPTVADRWFASSQVHRGCGCRLIAPTKMAELLVCAKTGEKVDRDRNAAMNLRDWPEAKASPGPVRPSVPVATRAADNGGTDPGPVAEETPQRGSDRKTRPQGKARRGETRTKTPQGEAAA
jgi:putative transposase